MAVRCGVAEAEAIENRGRPEKYPFDEWFDGAWWKLERGLDFQVKAPSMRTAIFSAARRRNLKVATRISKNNGILYVRAVGTKKGA